MKAYDFIIILTSVLFSSKLHADTALVLRFDSPDMKLVTDVIRKDLAKQEIKELIITEEMSFDKVQEAIVKEKPDILVGLDNLAVSHIKAIQKKSGPLESLPGAATMALNLHHELDDAKNMCGIAYEVPAFSIVTKFRSYVTLEINRVLTYYRKSEFDTAFNAAVSQLKTVGIELIGIDLDAYSSKPSELNKKVEETLSDTYDGKPIHAILVPSDNYILNRDGFTKVWLKKAKTLKIPLLCNIENFANPEYDFCSYAVYPDFRDLGRQFAEQLKEVIEHKTPPKELGVDFIVATKEKANPEKLEKLKIVVKQP
jgi:ABC-type uncharacterized transport system substrate-binding protein